ncbi:hypothetical protein D915_000991 [Fasciola hepatica]|uniref:Uncharacterized protein n=1 Tax=Fasciola hepatica TaxID=6192 RepID=A0A4E0RQT7_FASHE|nr:hypothetical protein D915_000991 [Fasciola hepatica]
MWAELSLKIIYLIYFNFCVSSSKGLEQLLSDSHGKSGMDGDKDSSADVDVGEQLDERKHGRLYKWLNAKPIRDAASINPMAGYAYPEIGGDSIEFPPAADVLVKYRCYTCIQCDDYERSDYHIETECTECVAILRGSGLWDRFCSRWRTSYCRKNLDAKCCQGHLCNHISDRPNAPRTVLFLLVFFVLIRGF